MKNREKTAISSLIYFFITFLLSICFLNVENILVWNINDLTNTDEIIFHALFYLTLAVYLLFLISTIKFFHKYIKQGIFPFYIFIVLTLVYIVFVSAVYIFKLGFMYP